jgi:SAM-dependent methyltransferase
MDPNQRRTAETFDSYRNTYSKSVDDAVAFTGLRTDFFTRVKAGYIVDIVRAHFGEQPVDALDVGCGVGNYHGLLAPTFHSLSGVDVSAACIETARRHHPSVDYRIYEGNRLPHADQSFDLAFAICVLHHVSTAQWSGFMNEMRRVLRPGGLALVFEHNPRNPLTMKAVNNCPFDADAVLLRSEELESLMGAAGFADVRSRFILSVPAGGSLLRRVDRLFAGLPFGAQYYVQGTA